MNKVYYKTVDEQVGRDNVPPDGIPVYIESVEVRGMQLGLFAHADTEVVITYRLAGGTEVPGPDRVESKHLRAAPETDGTWGPDDEAGLIRDMEDEIPMPGGPFGDGMK